jgi:hypothetical protein
MNYWKIDFCFLISQWLLDCYSYHSLQVSYSMTVAHQSHLCYYWFTFSFIFQLFFVCENLAFCISPLFLQIAKIVEVAPIRVYEVSTFYTMFNRAKVFWWITAYLAVIISSLADYKVLFNPCRWENITFWCVELHLVWFVVHVKSKKLCWSTLELSGMVCSVLLI